MEIRTKFNVGDKVWFIDYDSENGIWFVLGSYKIWKIFVQVFNDTQDIQYGLLRYDNYYWYMQEKNCFETKEQAQKECNRRNINCDECGDIDCEDCAKFKIGEG